MSTEACAAPVLSVYKSFVLHLEVSVYKSLCCTCKNMCFCAAPGSVCLQEPVLHLYVQCTNCTCAFVLPLKVSVYKRLVSAHTCAFLLALEVPVYKSL
jgi:hypothetical protein